jgi:hypothetical protein
MYLQENLYFEDEFLIFKLFFKAGLNEKGTMHILEFLFLKWLN